MFIIGLPWFFENLSKYLHVLELKILSVVGKSMEKDSMNEKWVRIDHLLAGYSWSTQACFGFYSNLFFHKMHVKNKRNNIFIFYSCGPGKNHSELNTARNIARVKTPMTCGQINTHKVHTVPRWMCMHIWVSCFIKNW